MTQQAMILAAGYGKRLQPLTKHTPKPLIRVGGKPLIVWHIERLAQAGIQHIVINHSWLGEQIVDYLKDGSQWGVHLQYSAEPRPLETATGVKRALKLLHPEPFLLISSDIWCPWPAHKLKNIAQTLDGQRKKAHLLLVQNPKHHSSGDMFFTTPPLVNFQSKRNETVSTKAKSTPPQTTYTYSGLAAVHPHLFAQCPTNEPLALRVPLSQAMQTESISATVIKEPWFDVGTIQRLEALQQYLAQNAQEVMI